jgi:hypothetical protein
MRNRNVIVAAIAAALAVFVAGCGSDSCKSEQMAVDENTLPQSCSVAASQPVTVSFQTCALCNQGTPTCDVDTSQMATLGVVEINALGEACDPGNSCPTPSCGLNGADLRTVSCTFMAPATGGPLDVVVFDAVGGIVQDRHIQVFLDGSTNSCI